jgi:hypothetical protein
VIEGQKPRESLSFSTRRGRLGRRIAPVCCQTNHSAGFASIENLCPACQFPANLRLRCRDPRRSRCLHRSFCGGPRVRIHLPPGESHQQTIAARKAQTRSRGTEGSNPAPSSGESVSRPHPLFLGREPDFPRGCAWLTWRPGRQRRAECFDFAPTGGNVSVGAIFQYRSAADAVARMPSRSQRSRAFSGLN